MLNRRIRISIAAALAAVAVAVAVPLAAANLRKESRTLLGPEVRVGNGTARMFVDLGTGGEPHTIGISLTENALNGLATHMNTTSRCFDKNGDGVVGHGECLVDYEATLALPQGAAALQLPFRWSTVNWNPEGHAPPAPPERHAPAGYIDVGASVAAMGNHLIDAKDPELADPSLGFSHTFIYGTYDGKVIFLEPMVSRAFLAARPDDCRPIRTAAAYSTTGYYPTSYCVRYDLASATYRITLEGLQLQQAQ